MAECAVINPCFGVLNWKTLEYRGLALMSQLSADKISFHLLQSEVFCLLKLVS